MALSKYQSTQETTNFARIVRIIFGPCTDVLRDVLRKEIAPSTLSHKLKTFNVRHRKPLLNSSQQQLVYGDRGDYSDFNITLLYLLLRSLCSIPPHANGWGRDPCPRDRSLSANIERIRFLRNESAHFSKFSLSNSEFEKKWTTIFTIVQEVERYIGSSTKYQETLRELKWCFVDLNDEESLILNFRGVDKLQNEITKLEVELGQTKKSIASLNVKDIVDEMTKTTVQGTVKGGGRSGSKAKLSFGQTNVMEDFEAKAEDEGSGSEKQPDIRQIKITKIFEAEDIPQRRLEHITSESLKELLGSFKVKFQAADVYGNESFARTILNDDTFKLETAIQSLPREIVLTMLMNAKTLNMLDPSMPQVDACVFEVDVVYEGVGDGNGDQFKVIRKGITPNMLFKTSEDKRIRVMLIRSQFLPVIASKLIVYKSFKHEINENEIFLQHEYEDYDDVAKLIAYRLLSSFCSSLESMIYAFTTDLQENMSDEFDKLLTTENIKEICLNTFMETAYKPFGKRTTRDWSYAFAEFITSKLSKEELDGADAWEEIKSTCRKTVDDLKFILSEVEKFQSNELQVDQKKQIEEWYKREISETKSLLRNNPSIIKYIAGHKEEGRKEVVKVFVSNDDENTKRAFIKCCKVSENTHFEFVKVQRTENKKKQNKEKQRLERKVFAVENSERKQLTEIIQKEEDKMYARHSHLIGIRIGNISQGDDLEKEQLGIILYCLDKTLIPFGEKPLPNSIKGWQCDVREDFFMFGACPNPCRKIYPNLTELGCSIGIKSDLSAGSAGFFYESKNPDNPYGSGFLTASHVAIKQSKLLSSSGKRLLQHNLRRKEHIIVHPSLTDDDTANNAVGLVVEAYCGNYGDPPTGLDVAAVRNDAKRPEVMETIPVMTNDDLTGGTCIEVKKTGRTTETTFGQLECVMTSVNEPSGSGLGEPMGLKLVYGVSDMYLDEPFFERGDSGSGVFVLGEEIDRPLGIAIGFSTKDQLTFVCKIDSVLQDLDIDIVKYKTD